MENNGFFRDKYFNQIGERFDAQDARLKDIEEKIDELIRKIIWVYAFAAGSSFIFSILTTLGIALYKSLK